MSLRHDRRHFVRAIMEGVAYRMYSVLLALEEVTGEIEELRGSGGFLRSPLWIQIMADVCGRELVVPQVIETTSLRGRVSGDDEKWGSGFRFLHDW